MSQQSTEQLIHDLAQDAPAVRRSPRLRVIALVIVGVWAVAVVLITRSVSQLPY